jgi:hypothetical protein
MRPSIFLSGATAALLLARPAHSQTHSRLTQEQYLALGKQYTGWFFSGRADSLLAHMSPESSLHECIARSPNRPRRSCSTK